MTPLASSEQGVLKIGYNFVCAVSYVLLMRFC
jgi:hypothetical protein